MSMRRWYLGASALALAGCAALPGLQLASGGASLQVLPHLVSGAYRAQALVAPWTSADVEHVEVRLLSLSDAGAEVPARVGGTPVVQDVPRAALDAPFTMTGLLPNARYRLRARAYKATGSLAADVISVEAAAFVDILMRSDDRPVVATLSIPLQDVPFDGQASPSIAIVPGDLVPVGSESLRLGEPVTE